MSARPRPIAAALLLGCREEVAPPAAADPFAGCPPLAWVVQLDGIVTDEVHTVDLLPGGDILVAGTYSGIPRIGLGPDQRLRPSENYRDGFVARLGPDGVARWWRTVGTVGMDEMPAVEVGPEVVWAMASVEVGGTREGLCVDGEPLLAMTSEECRYQKGAVALDLTTGEARMAVAAEVRAGSAAWTRGGVATDPDGNVYVSSAFSSGTVVAGPYRAEDFPDRGRTTITAMLASWDASGRPRWLTTVGTPSAETGPVDGLTWSEGLLQWPLELRGGRGVFRTSDGGETVVDVDDDLLATVVPIDPETGAVLPLGFRMEKDFLLRLERSGTGELEAIGNLDTSQRGWWDAAGERHELPGYSGFVATLDATGAILDLWAPEPSLSSVTAYERAADGTAAIGGMPGRYPIGVGTPHVYALPVDDTTGRDAVALTDDASGTPRCLAWLMGDATSDVVDVAPLPDGGMVVVGKFAESTTFYTPAGEQATLTAEGYEDGYIAWFAEP